MINQQLIDYVKEQNQLGTPADTIIDNLLKKGWQQEDIDAAFKGNSNTENIS